MISHFISRTISTHSIKKRTLFTSTHPILKPRPSITLNSTEEVQFKKAYNSFISRFGTKKTSSNGAIVYEARLSSTIQSDTPLEKQFFTCKDDSKKLHHFLPDLPTVVCNDLNQQLHELLQLSNKLLPSGLLLLSRKIIIPPKISKFSSGLHTDSKIYYATNSSYHYENCRIKASLYPHMGPGQTTDSPNLLLSPQYPHNVDTFPIQPNKVASRYSLILALFP